MGVHRGLGARWRRRRPLRARLALAASAAVALVAVGVCAAAFLVIRYELFHQLDLNLTQSATLAAQQDRGERAGVIQGECRFLSAPACAQIVPADPADDPSARFLLPVAPPVREVAAGDRDPYFSSTTLAGHPARMFTTPVGEGRALQVVLRADPVEKGVRQAALLLAAVGAAGVLVAAALGYWVSRTGLAPVARLTATAERIAATRDARHRIELPPGPARREDEVTRLAASFNTMLGELERSVTAQRRLVADASHELRTPLTALRTNAELLARADRLSDTQRARASGALGRQVREVTRLVGDLIELAREEEPSPFIEHVALPALVEHAVRTARSHWPEVEFVLSPEPGAEPLLVAGVPARLSRLLGNLLDNAAKFSPRGLPVEVEVMATVAEAAVAEAAGRLVVTVRDHGPGITPEDLPYVFDRFYRAETARSLPGSGLGLAMARQIARAHGAELTAERAAGGGALLRLVVPVVGRSGG
ncbi:HAMP domain-containing sensor histidine kinase [Streptomyces tsukubensis]|uniref:histidine kinase n=1 Tax=Streptomyces tsukubensis TaxID=83656 RepID=A0A1V4A882_9ACTN|nr:HAMP domain-containing sensor histidine kinase [Streptomyces tsukubensis]OON78896.1 two-component sensor histidine kinase [Streptomyces tsukubensis]QFR97783.1 HAMP domain-containing protein [Streptomyces tsukubensis]